MMKTFWIAITLLSASIQQIEGFSFIQSLGPHTVFAGPEVCYSTRKREGGSKQSGYLYGGHLRYDRICPKSLYWAVDGYFDTGIVSGKTASGRKIKSILDEYEAEARLGYSFYFESWRELLIIPYGAYSYFYGSNKFRKPSPVLYQLHDRMHLGSGGLWISFSLFEHCRCGIDFTAKYMFIGRNEVTDDPDFDNVTLAIESEWQYEVDLPIEFTLPFCDKSMELRFVPFYRFRHFGGKPNYPFDYVETKFEIYGAQLMLYIGF